MHTDSQTEEKKTRKYRIIDRATQAKILDESHYLSQRQLAKKHNIPSSTLEHWINRKNALRGKDDPNVVNFFESSSGQAWLHALVLATFMVFHQNGSSGIPDLSEFFEMIKISPFVGTSISALQKVGKIIDEQTIVFGKEESERLASNMPHKNITGALDENFIMQDMTLILMDPVSGYILAEDIEEKEMPRLGTRLRRQPLKD